MGPEIFFFLEGRYLDDTLCLFNSCNETDALLFFFYYIKSQYTNTEKKENRKLLFLDVLIDNTHPDFPVTLGFRKKTCMALLTSFFSLTPFSNKMGLIRTLVSRALALKWPLFPVSTTKINIIAQRCCKDLDTSRLAFTSYKLENMFV